MGAQAIPVLSVGQIDVGQTNDSWQMSKNNIPTALGYAGGFPVQIANGGPTVGALTAMPFVSGPGGQFDQLSYVVAVAPGGAALAHLGVYDSDATGLPRNLLFDSGAVNRNIGPNAPLSVPLPPLVLKPGTVYYLACLMDAGPAGTVAGWGTGTPFFGWGGANFSQPIFLLGGAFAFGPLPDPFPLAAVPPSVQALVNGPVMFIRMA